MNRRAFIGGVVAVLAGPKAVPAASPWIDEQMQPEWFIKDVKVAEESLRIEWVVYQVSDDVGYVVPNRRYTLLTNS